jgi:hypothetical protein
MGHPSGEKGMCVCLNLDPSRGEPLSGHPQRQQKTQFWAGAVLHWAQKYPEIVGSKCSGVAKPGEIFQRLSPEIDRLPLHHSPRHQQEAEQIQ